jgi:hypothetical protein
MVNDAVSAFEARFRERREKLVTLEICRHLPPKWIR